MFSLRYAVDEPLATVLTAAAEDAYQRVASLLWALKRAEHSLGAAWVLLNAMQRQLARLAARARREGLACPGNPCLMAVKLCIKYYTNTCVCVRLNWELPAPAFAQPGRRTLASSRP